MNFLNVSRQAVAPANFRSYGFFCYLLVSFFFVYSAAAETNYETDIIKAAHSGDAQSQYALSLLYEYGGTSIDRDKEQATHWLKKAGQEKVAGACLYLGLKYENGNGVKQNYAKAICWYLCAAKQDWPMAQFFLAGLYERGKGVKSSPDTALAWFGLAKEHAYPRAEAEFLRLQKETGRYDSVVLLRMQDELMHGAVKSCR